ncbi:MAG TPA: hypothetical protein VKE51_07680 [Vicinamibacterales bacterium]|nr:hypothetical protein [Vicinamibacterales bacterium]
MRFSALSTTALATLIAVWIVSPSGHAAGRQQPPPTVQVPTPGVPQIMTLEGNFVRVAYNNEGYVILGYQLANRSVGEKWMLLEVGMTVLNRTPNYTLKRDAVSLDIPDGTTVPLPTVTEYRSAEASVQGLQNRSRVQRDSINYFPPSASQACRLGFFADLGAPAMAWDQVELSSQRACLGRLYFQIPNGIAHGQYWLNVKFAQSLVRVPFRILTEDEEKLLSKNFKSIKKQVDAAFKRKG